MSSRKFARLDDLEQREVAVVADRLDTRDRLVGSGQLLDLQERRVCDDVRAGQHQARADHDRRSGAVRRRSCLPRAIEIGILRRRKDANDLGVGHRYRDRVTHVALSYCTGRCSRSKPSHLNTWQPSRSRDHARRGAQADRAGASRRADRGDLGDSHASRPTRCAHAGEVPAARGRRRDRRADRSVREVPARGADGARFEAVRIPLENPARFTVCVSSQVGCALGVRSVRPAGSGLARNLDGVGDRRAGARRARAAAARPRARRRVSRHGRAAREPRCGARGDRGVARSRVRSASTRARSRCAPRGCRAGFASSPSAAPNVRLGLSIDSGARRAPSIDHADREARTRSTTCSPPCADHARATGLSPMWAVTLLAGVNDSDDDAQRARRSRARVRGRHRPRPRISIIAYNAIGAGRSVHAVAARGRVPRRARAAEPSSLLRWQRCRGRVRSARGATCIAFAHASGPRHRAPLRSRGVRSRGDRDPARLAPQVRGRQADRPACASIACCTARCTTRRTTGSSRARTARTTIRSTSSC